MKIKFRPPVAMLLLPLTVLLQVRNVRPAESDSLFVVSDLLTKDYVLAPANLYELSLTNGQVISTVPIAKGGREDTPQFKILDPERGTIAFVVPRDLPREIRIIQVKNPAKITSIPLNYRHGVSLLYPFFIEFPPHSLQIAIETSTGKGGSLISADLSASAELRPRQDETLKYGREAGRFSTVGRTMKGPWTLRVGKDRPVESFIWNRPVDMGIPSPPSLMDSIDDAALEIKNDAALVLRAYVPATQASETSTHHIYSFATQRWSELTVPGEASSLRAFGKWLAL